MKIGSLILWLALAVAGSLRATDYYVDGQTGSDVATGGTAAQPWKTIAYALGQIPTPGSATATHTLFVAGNQVYSVATNGEAFPLTPAYNVAIIGQEATPSNYPVLMPPAGTTGMLFDPTVIYNRNQVTMRRLAFDGGDYGARMGANANIRHRPRFWQCEFRNQSLAGVFLDMQGMAIQDPRFVQCLFENMATGIRGEASGTGAVLVPDIEECVFLNLSADGVSIRDTSGVKSNVGGSVRNSRFERCCRGVAIYSAINAQFTNTVIERCCFIDSCNTGVHVLIDRPGDPMVTVRDCSFFGGQAGVLMDGILAPGPYSLTLENNHAENTGIAFGAGIIRGQGDFTVTSRNNIARGCTSGFYVDVQDAGVLFSMTSRGDRALNCGIGLFTRGVSANGAIDVQGAIFSNNSGHGASLTSAMPTLLRSVTLADNSTGLEFTGSNHMLDHLILAGNATDVVGPAAQAIDYSCIEGGTWPGTGNLGNTSPLLMRPHYKLSDSSPCIDAGDAATAFVTSDYEGDPRASIGVMNGAALPDIGADEYVYAGSVQTYGIPGAGLIGVCPHIGSPNTQAAIGTMLQIDLSDAIDLFGNTASVAVPMLGNAEANPFVNLSPFGAPCNLLLQDVFAVGSFISVDPTGAAVFNLNIPAKPVLPGVTFLFQWVAFKPNANAAGIVLSDGLRVTVGQ